MQTITNINGTSDITACRCGSWLKHWQNFSRQILPHYCPVSGCFKTDLDVSDTIAFVSADKSETCEWI